MRATSRPCQPKLLANPADDPEDGAREQDAAGEPGQSPAEQHGGRARSGRAHAGALGRDRVVAQHPQPEPEAAAGEQEPADHHHHQRHDHPEPEVQLVEPTELGQARPARQALGLVVRLPGGLLLAQQVVARDHPGDELPGHVDEQQRADDLVDTVGRSAGAAATPGPRRAPGRGGEQHHGHHDEPAARPRCRPTATPASPPTSTWPSWPMFTSPARLVTTVPSATSASGAAWSSVWPTAGQVWKLPAWTARTTSIGELPVSSTATTATPIAAASDRRYRPTASTRPTRRRRATSAAVEQLGVGRRRRDPDVVDEIGTAPVRCITGDRRSRGSPAHQQAEALEVDLVAGHLARRCGRGRSPRSGPTARGSPPARSRSAARPRPSAAAARSRPDMYSIAPTSRPARRLRGDEHLGPPRQLPRQHHPLLVAARQRPHRGVRRRGLDVELGRSARSACARSLRRLIQRPARDRVEVVEHQVLGHRSCRARSPSRGGPRGSRRRRPRAMRAGAARRAPAGRRPRRVPESRSTSDDSRSPSGGLTVALDAGAARRSRPARTSSDRPSSSARPSRLRHDGVARSATSAGVAATAGGGRRGTRAVGRDLARPPASRPSAAASARSDTSRPTMARASAGGRCLARSACERHDATVPHDGDPVGGRQDLVELVADEDDGPALGLHRLGAAR